MHARSRKMELMKNHFLRIASIILLSGLRSPAVPLSVEFEGNSTLHRFSGVAKEHAAEIKAGIDGHPTLLVTIPVKNLDTDHEGRDEKMREMFEADKFPEIRGVADLATLQDPAKNRVPVELTIHDQTRIIEALKITDAADPAGTIRLSWTVSLSSFGLKAPTVIGLIRVYDEVNVTAVFPPEVLTINNTPSAELH